MIMVPDLPGFAEPVADAQGAFRAVLDAMAHPGRILSAGAGLTAPASLEPAMAAALLSLVDADTSLWLDPAFAQARDWLAFHTGARAAGRMAAADFVVVAALPPLSALALGTDEAPELGATVILGAAALGEGTRYRLSGPGLAAPTEFAARGLGDGFVAFWHDNHALFPRGIDLLVCAGTHLAALPRSVTVEAL